MTQKMLINTMKQALHAAETVMMLVEPRSHKREYLAVLDQIRVALKAAL